MRHNNGYKILWSFLWYMSVCISVLRNRDFYYYYWTDLSTIYTSIFLRLNLNNLKWSIFANIDTFMHIFIKWTMKWYNIEITKKTNIFCYERCFTWRFMKFNLNWMSQNLFIPYGKFISKNCKLKNLNVPCTICESIAHCGVHLWMVIKA